MAFHDLGITIVLQIGLEVLDVLNLLSRAVTMSQGNGELAPDTRGSCLIWPRPTTGYGWLGALSRDIGSQTSVFYWLPAAAGRLEPALTCPVLKGVPGSRPLALLPA